jgi:hypothetical protein
MAERRLTKAAVERVAGTGCCVIVLNHNDWGGRRAGDDALQVHLRQSATRGERECDEKSELGRLSTHRSGLYHVAHTGAHSRAALLT